MMFIEINSVPDQFVKVDGLRYFSGGFPSLMCYTRIQLSYLMKALLRVVMTRSEMCVN